jgi:hypothetical protein
MRDIKQGGKMKKFFVGLLSIFMICGGIILASCGESKVSLSIDQTYKEIVVLDEDNIEPVFVTCVVNGVDNGKVSVSSSQNSIVSASVEYNSSSNQNIISLIAGDMEGTATVTVTTLDQTVKETITVFVHGEVTGMSEKVYTNGQSQLYAIRGGQRTLNANELIDFETTLNTSRKDISWKLKEEDQYITLDGNVLSIDENYKAGVSEPKLTLTATSIFNPDISEDITLTILDKIDTSSVNLAFAFNRTMDYTNIFSQNENGDIVKEKILLTSNREADPDNKTAYIRMIFADCEKYSIEPVISYKNTNVDVGQISILSDSNQESGVRYFIAEGKDNANITANASFKIGHKEFAYSVSTDFFEIGSYEKIDKIKIFDENGFEIKATQSIYNSYSLDKSLGQEFEVALLPTTVQGYTGQYNLELQVNDLSYVGKPAPIEMHYIDEDGYARVLNFGHGENKSDVTNIKVVFKSISISSKQVYIRAVNDIPESLLSTLTFNSEDNKKVKTSVELNLQRAPTSLVFEDKNQKNIYFSSAYGAEKTLSKEFKVYGQTSLTGLSVVYSNAFVDSPVLVQTGSSLDEGVNYKGEPYVQFRVSFDLLSSGLGQTRNGEYKIVHTNGISSDAFDLNVLLPLTDAYLKIDNLTSYNAVVGHRNEGNLFDANGTALPNKSNSLSFIMLKNGATLPFALQTNSVNLGNGSVSSVLESAEFRFVDEEKGNELSQEDYQNLIANFENASRESNVVSINSLGNTFSSHATGTTYILIKFKGKSIGEDGIEDVTFYRVVKVESFVAPATLKPNVSSVEVYAENSVSEDDQSTEKTVIINFAQNGVTYKEPTNFIFEYDPNAKDDENKNLHFTNNGDSINFGNFSIDNITIFDSYMSFVVRGISTNGQTAFNKNLSIAYVYKDENKNAYIALENSIDITVKNADRIERVTWESFNEDGIYFDLSDNGDNSQIIVTSVSPTNARNKDLKFIAVNETGNIDNSFVKFSQVDSGSDVVTLNAQTGRTGKIYILPKDAINNERIYFYDGFITDGDGNKVYDNHKKSIMLADIGKEFENIKNYFFINNNKEEIKLSNIIVEIPVTIADGESFDTAYRIYSESQLSSFNPKKFYTFMNNVTISQDTAVKIKTLGTFEGGIQGATPQTTIVFEGSNIIGINNGTIRNITFAGTVNGSSGFVATTNNGTMQNVTVDVTTNENGYIYSSLNASDDNVVGGLVGLNGVSGTIENCAVLGLNIASNVKEVALSSAGGLVGTNNGKISYSRVEFYNFSSGANTITANSVAGLAYANNGRIERSFAYNYSSENVLNGDSKALVYSAGDSSILTLSFASVGVALNHDDDSSIKLTNGYVKYSKAKEDGTGNEEIIDYYDEDGFIRHINDSNFDTSIANNENFVVSGEEGFLNYINNGEAHLKDVFQDRVLTKDELEDLNPQTQEVNGFYKTLSVSQNSAIGFFYKVEDLTLTAKEKNELDSYNRVSLKEFVGDSSGIVAISDNAYVANIVGNEIVFTGVGKATITLVSKQNYQLKKDINIEVVYSLSKLKASYNFGGKSVEILKGNTHNLQTGATRSITYTFDKNIIRLGASAKAFNLVENNLNLRNNEYILTTPRVLKITENNVVSGRSIEVNPILSGREDDNDFSSYQSAINAEFGHNFKLSTYQGALDLRYSLDKVDISPAVTGSIKAVLTTSNEGDTIAPIVRLGDVELDIYQEEDGSYTASYSQGENKRLKISVSRLSSKEISGNKFEIEFLIEISVHENYKWAVSNAEKYDVTFYSLGKTVSDSFDLTVSPQAFNYIDVNNYKVEYITSANIQGVNKDIYHIENKASSVLAPGNNSILKVNINPQFANYHHLKISYTGEQTLNAVVMKKMVAKNADDENATEFYENTVTSGVENFGNVMIVTPSLDDRKTGNMFFNIWINQSVNVNNTNLTFEITFCDENDKPITSVKSFIRVSYLQEPNITVNGQRELSFVAKGETAKGKLYFDADQTVSTNPIMIEDAKGIRVVNQREVESDIAGRRLIEFDIVVELDAEAIGGNNAVKLSANVKGEVQQKTAYNTMTIVDLAINTNPQSIKLEGSDSDTLQAYVGVGKMLKFNYTFMPEEYSYDLSDGAQIEAVRKLQQKRNEFSSSGLYIEGNEGKSYYSINYNSNHTQEKPLAQRIDYFNEETGGWSSILNTESNTFVSSVNGLFTISMNADASGNYRENQLLITGLKETSENSSVRMRMTTYINYAGQTLPIVKEFNVAVSEYSDEDLPIRVTNEQEFLKMAEGKEQNYILADDITLKNYSPLNTENIASLDGNGHVINIESFKTEKENTSQNTLQLALFNNVTSNTTLKNVVVNVYNAGRQILADIDDYSSFEIAGFAISNAGIITNCSVVAFNSERQEGEDISPVGTYGLNVTYIKGTGTSSPQYLTDGSNWSSQVAGFAIRNTGSITNSKVGGDSVYLIGNKYTSDLNDGDPRYTLNIVQLEYFNIKGQGNMSGFVLDNSGYISASSVKNLSMNNQSEAPQYYTAGFVGNNTSSIITSYVEGVKSNDDRDSYKFCRMGSMIQSKMGVVSGFAYQTSESATIKDSYSNIGIANSDVQEETYLASGFIYINKGSLYNCYSSSQIQNQTYSQMNFSGVDSNGNLLNTDGSYENCYYYNPAYTEVGDSGEPTESSFKTGAGQLRDVTKQGSFYGFAIGGETSTNTIWRMTLNEGIKLVEPDMLSFSHRYYQVLPNQEDVEKDEQKYILPYATIMLDGDIRDMSYGSIYNPIIIRTPQEFLDVTGVSKSSSINEKVDAKAVKGVYRLVSNLDFNELASSEEQVNGIDIPSTRKSLTGIIYGNGFTISNINLAGSQQRETFAYGLFGAIESVKNSSGNIELEAMILNLNLTISKVINNKASAVGALAGFVRDASVVNVNLSFNDNASVEGSNFVGGVVGFAFANSTLKNLTTENTKVVASRRVSDNTEPLNAESLATLRNSNEFKSITTSLYSNLGQTEIDKLIKKVEKMSFAGGIVGFVDIFEGNGNDAYYSETDFTKSKDFLTYNVVSIKAEGPTFVQAGVAGGLIGLSGCNTSVKDAQLIIDGIMSDNQTHIVSIKHYAGAIIGQSFGTLSQLVATHDAQTQRTIQTNMGRYYNGKSFDKSLERGAIDLFSSISGEYNRIAVGGLVGYVGSGSMNLSYSNLNAVDLEADYAGGLIGEIDIHENVQAYKSTNGTVQGYESKYIINQSYASGDVRGKIAAGGIIGKLNECSDTKEKAGVALHAVNSVNFFSVYNYKTGENFVDIDRDNDIFSSNNVYAFVGEFAKKSNAVNLPNTDADGNIVEDLSPWLSLVIETTSEVDNEGNETQSQGATVSRIYRYFTNASQGEQVEKIDVAPKFAPNVDSELIIEVKEDEEGNKDKLSYLTKTEEPEKYADIKTGKSFTQGSFLSNSFWSKDNWVHEDTTLFPTLKYTDAFGYFIYLDQFNIGTVIKTMRENSNVEVVVRGRKYKDNDQEIGDINMIEYFQTLGTFKQIQNFAGTIRSLKNTSSSSGELVKIILDRPLFESTSSGLTLKDTVISFENRKVNGVEVESGNIYNGNNFSGAFANGTMTEAVISNVRFEFKNAGMKLTGENVGLIAPEISSSNISNTEILIDNSDKDNSNTDKSDTKPFSNDSFLSVSLGTKNVGLFAGVLRQISAVRQMNFSMNSIKVADVENFNKNNPFIAFNSSSVNIAESVSVGSMIGRAEFEKNNSGNKQAFSIALQSLSTTPTFKFSAPGNLFETLNVGGMIGTLGTSVNLSVNANFDTNTVFVNSELIVTSPSKSKTTSLNYGGIVGYIENTGSVVSISNDGKSTASVNTKITSILNKNNNVWKEVNYGGLVGKSERQVGVKNFKTYNVTNGETPVEKDSSKTLTLNRDKLAYSESVTPIEANSINYGGYVGDGAIVNIETQKECAIEFNNDSNEQVNIISLKAETVNAGGLVGQAKTVSLSGNGRIKVIDSFNISNLETTSSSTKAEEKTNSIANVGGFVGSASNVNFTSSRSNVSRYDGHILLDTESSINAGGIVGRVVNEDSTNNSVNGSATLDWLSFGGDIRLSNKNSSEINIGGTAGFIKVKDVTMQNNYNYGDVFVAKEKTAMKEDYSFGGLIGKVDIKNLSTAEIIYNYSLVTHNSDITTKDNNGTIHALFGTQVAKEDKSFTVDSNYYNHGVTLTTDNQGIDMGYMSAYNNDGRYGYGIKKENTSVVDLGYNTDSNIVTVIKGVLGDNVEEGSKLNPKSLTSMENGTNSNNKLSSDTSVKYYYIPSDTDFTWVSDDSKSYALTNVAIIGDANAIVLKGFKDNFISNMSGYSYISDLVVNIENMVVGEGNETEELKVGGLVGEMRGGNIFAVGIDGNIEAAGKKAVAVGGLVGNMQRGTINDSYSVADILYRAASSGSHSFAVSASGIVGYGSANSEEAYIHGTFSGGSLTSYIDAKLHAFAGGENISIDNSYTYTYLDWNDHTSVDTSSSGKLDVWGGNSGNMTYDQNGINEKNISNKEGLSGKTYTDVGFDGVKDIKFNFGYPTRIGFNYLKPSSLFEITNYNRGNGTVTNLNNGKNLSDDSKSNSAETYKFEYRRLTVQETNNLSGNLAYGIPNASVFANVGKINNSNISMLTLLNDIDLSTTSLGTATKQDNNSYQKWNSVTIEYNKFDGNGHTLHNFYNTIFSKLNGKTVTNLRITNDNTINMSAPLLVSELNGTIVSNLTISGRITGSTSGALGAVANTSTGASILTAVTNMVNIAVDATADLQVGGLVGKSDDGTLTINYSSNYAPIEVANNNDVSIIKDNSRTERESCVFIFTGGLVGNNSGTTNIYNSYNANAVINGYRSRSSVSENTEGKSADYKTGGLVGKSSSTLNIYNSYNSGIVKSGNKNVTGKDYRSPSIIALKGSLHQCSFAGGIIGYGNSSVTIDNCFNEGSIEALGTDPVTEYDLQIEEVEITEGPLGGYKNTIIKSATLYQTDICKTNVYAYDIGYNVTSIKSSSGKNNIVRNGTSLNGKQILSVVEIGDEYCGIKSVEKNNGRWSYGETDGDGTYKNSMQTYFESYYTRLSSLSLESGKQSSTNLDRAGVFKNQGVEEKDIAIKNSEGIVNLIKGICSIDKQNIPVSIVYKVPYQNFVQVIVPGADKSLDYLNLAKIENVYYGFYANQELLQINFKDGFIDGKYESDKFSGEKNYEGYKSAFDYYNKGDNLSNTDKENRNSEDDKNVKQQCKYETNSQGVNKTTIKGEAYNLVSNGPNASAALTAGNTTLTFEIDISSIGSLKDLTLDSVKLYKEQGNEYLGEFKDTSSIVSQSEESSTISIKVTAVLEEGNYNVKADVTFIKTTNMEMIDLTGSLIYDDVEESNTAGLFGIYVGESLSEYIGEGLNLTWNDGDKESSNIIHVRKNNKDYYMVYDSSSKVLYFAPGAKLNGEPINEVVDEYTKDVFKSMFSGNCEIVKTISGTATQNITGENVDKNISKNHQLESEIEYEFYATSVGDGAIKAISYEKDGEDLIINLQATNEAKFGGFNAKYIFGLNQTIENSDGEISNQYIPLLSNDGYGKTAFDSDWQILNAQGDVVVALTENSTSENFGLRFVGKADEFADGTEINEILESLDILKSVKYAPVINLDSQYINYEETTDDGLKLIVNISKNVDERSIIVGNEHYEFVDGNILPLNRDDLISVSFGGVEIFEGYDINFKMQEKISSYDIDITLSGETSEHAKLFVNGETIEGDLLSGLKYLKEGIEVSDIENIMLDIVGQVKYITLSKPNIDSIEGKPEGDVNLTLAGATLNFVNGEDKYTVEYIYNEENQEFKVANIMAIIKDCFGENGTGNDFSFIMEEKNDKYIYVSNETFGDLLRFKDGKFEKAIISESDSEVVTWEAVNGNSTDFMLQIPNFNDNNVEEVVTWKLKIDLDKIPNFDNFKIQDSNIYTNFELDTDDEKQSKFNWDINGQNSENIDLLKDIAFSLEEGQTIINNNSKVQVNENGQIEKIDASELKKLNNKFSISITEKTDPLSATIEKTGQGETCYNIILIEDIIVETAPGATQKINISGNGKNIIFINNENALFSNGDNKYINNVIILGVVKNESFLTSKNKYYNVSTYGIVSEKETGCIINNENTEIQCLNNFISVETKAGKDITLATSVISSDDNMVKSYGSLFAGDGEDGESWGKSKDKQSGKVEKGNDGGDIVSQGIDLLGLIKVGIGGKGGFGYAGSLNDAGFRNDNNIIDASSSLSIMTQEDGENGKNGLLLSSKNHSTTLIRTEGAKRIKFISGIDRGAFNIKVGTYVKIEVPGIGELLHSGYGFGVDVKVWPLNTIVKTSFTNTFGNKTKFRGNVKSEYGNYGNFTIYTLSNNADILKNIFSNMSYGTWDGVTWKAN